MSTHSTKPYLIRAIHEWCSDQGHTPYLAVAVDEHTQVPMEYVKAGEIALNVSLAATNRLRLGNDWIEFQARFGGVARDISIPIGNVSAIYARETGHGMAFEVSKAPAHVQAQLVFDRRLLHQAKTQQRKLPLTLLRSHWPQASARAR
jgi:stringent starvation protein B